MASLPSEIVSRVYDVVNEEPPVDPYKTLVARIEGDFQPTESEQVHKLLQGMQMGDKKPSRFLREMKELAKERVTDTVIKELFLKQLPTGLRNVLAVIETSNLESKAADRGWQYGNTDISEIGSEKQTQKSQTVEKPVNEMEKKFDELMGKMLEVMDRLSRQEKYVSSGRSRNCSQTPGRQGASKGRQRSNSRKRNPKWKLCYSHHWFGDKARSCEDWCERWPGNKNNNLEN